MVSLCVWFLFLICSSLSHGRLLRERSRPSDRKVDVFFSADRRMMTGLRTAVFSTLQTCTKPARLRLHIAIEPDDADTFRDTFGIAKGSTSRRLLGGASLELHMLDIIEFSNLYPKVGALREDGPSNYVRFFIDNYLPADSDRAVWLDADVVVQADITELADSLLDHPSKTVAFAKYPGSEFGFSGAYTIMSDVTNRSWAKEHISNKVLSSPVWNVGVLGFNMQHMREHHLRDRALQWVQLSQDVGLAKRGGSQTPFDLAALVHPANEEDPFIEVDASWNCWWGFMGMLTKPEEVQGCKVLHFAGKDKPWSRDATELLKGAALSRWNSVELDSRDMFR